ncbi:MAG: TaqI-like C-terminal specificity domain-containing protein, partial [Nostoc sp.]
LIAEDKLSAEALKPFLRGRDIKKWNIEFSDLYIIFANRNFPIEKYPSLKKHLNKYKEFLENRATINTHPWYELQQPQEGIFHYFETNKIVYQEIATYQAFAWDESGCYSNNKVYFIANATLYLLAILNSKTNWFFLKNITSKLQGGAYAMQTMYVSQIPIPTTSEADRLAIEALVQKCLDAKGQGVQKYEAEIDDRVAHLYALTTEEMKIIRGE